MDEAGLHSCPTARSKAGSSSTWATTHRSEPNQRSVHLLDRSVQVLDYTAVVPEELDLKLDRTEALELLAVVQATLNAIARSQELTVGAAILTGIKAKLIDALEA